MDDLTIIAGLQIFIFVFLVTAGIAFVWIGISNARIRAVFKANLPNHLELFRNRAQSQIESQVASSTESSDADKPHSTSPKRQISEDSKRRKNFLPATLTPYSTKSSFLSKEDIIRESFNIQQDILNIPNDTEEEEKSEKELTGGKSRNTSAASLQLFKSIQKEGDSMANDMKKQEKERKEKDREEKQKKQKEIEEKMKKETEKGNDSSSASSTVGAAPGAFNFNFGGGTTTPGSSNFNFGNLTPPTTTSHPATTTTTTTKTNSSTGAMNFNFSSFTKRND